MPAKYGRASDLSFVSGNAEALLAKTGFPSHGVFFFAPLGFSNFEPLLTDLPNLLNACGFYLQWGSDQNDRPLFLSTLPDRWRFRLIENIQPTQKFVDYTAFTDTDAGNDRDWITEGLAKPSESYPHVLAENIIALVVRPEVPEKDASDLGLSGPEGITSDYIYDSRSENGRTRQNARAAAQFAQLPPMLRVVMVAVDEKSAARLTTGTTPPAAFDTSAFFKDPSETQFQKDLNDLAKQLTDANVQFRIFNQVIPLRGAKFSATKEN